MPRRFAPFCLAGRATALLVAGALATACDSAPLEPDAPIPAGPASSEEPDQGPALTAGALSVSSGPFARWYNTADFMERDALKAVLATLANGGTEVLSMAASPGGGWVVTTANGFYHGGTLPSGLTTALSSLRRLGQPLRAVSINAANGWVAVGDQSYRSGGSVPASAIAKLDQYFANGWEIRDADITNTGYVILGSGTLASYVNVDGDLMQFLADRLRSKRRVEQVALGFDGRWAAVAGQEPAFEHVSDQLANRLRTAARDEVHVSRLALGPGDSYVLYSHGRATPTAGNTIEAIEYGTPGGDNLWERMDAIGMPGLSIAIIEDNKVAYARGYGVIRQGQDKHVLASTPFDMASLSKFIGALTMMRLDSDPQYDFDVDDSVVGSAVANGIIDRWFDLGSTKPGTYDFPNVDVSSALTVAHFLRHQSDLVKSGGSPGFTQGAGLSGATTLKMMLGYDCTSGCGYNGNNFAWTSGGAGPVASSYDSANFLVPQAVAEDVSGVEVHDLMSDLFFEPMGLTRISGDPWSPIIASAAWPHDTNGPRATRHVYPWVFAGGVHAATADYAEMMILALNQGRDSKGVQRIPAAAIARMLQVDNGNVAFGLFADAATHITESNDNRFRHSGSHGGRARTYMCGNPTRDGGIVIAFNADIADGPDANTGNDTNDLRTYVIGRYMAAVGWPGDCL